jgi:hypothetical protein
LRFKPESRSSSFQPAIPGRGGLTPVQLKSLKFLSALVALALASVLVPNAMAQCGLKSGLIKPSSWHPQFGTPSLHPTLARMDDDHDDGPSMVGMWHVVFTATASNPAGTIPPGGVIDNALVVWHADHTEIMNSVRPPQDGNFCLGVWEQTGRNRFYLNHFAWFGNQYPTDPPTEIGPAVGPTHITETITLAPDGCHFSGTFTLNAYLTNGTLVQTYTGTVAGTRITVDTTVGELL